MWARVEGWQECWRERRVKAPDLTLVGNEWREEPKTWIF